MRGKLPLPGRQRERERERDDSVIVAFIKAVRLTTGIYSKVTHHRIHFCLNFR